MGASAFGWRVAVAYWALGHALVSYDAPIPTTEASGLEYAYAASIGRITAFGVKSEQENRSHGGYEESKTKVEQENRSRVRARMRVRVINRLDEV